MILAERPQAHVAVLADLAREVAALAITLHTSLIKSAVRDVLDR